MPKGKKKRVKKKIKTFQPNRTYYGHHEIHLEEDEDFWLFIGVLVGLIAVWWAVVHLIDIYFDALKWWQEPLTIIPFFIIGIPYGRMVVQYGKNPLHWWPMFCGIDVELPDDDTPFHLLKPRMEKILDEFGPMRVYHEDLSVIRFRTKKDAVIFSLRNNF